MVTIGIRFEFLHEERRRTTANVVVRVQLVCTVFVLVPAFNED